jgi:hypothetical protein
MRVMRHKEFKLIVKKEILESTGYTVGRQAVQYRVGDEMVVDEATNMIQSGNESFINLIDEATFNMGHKPYIQDGKSKNILG